MTLQQNLQQQDDHVEIRVPRAALTMIERPTTVSQRTSEHALGIPRRLYLEAVRDYARDGGHVLELGKLRLVDVDAFVAWLGRRSRPQAPTTSTPRPSPVDALAAELGLVEVRP